MKLNKIASLLIIPLLGGCSATEVYKTSKKSIVDIEGKVDNYIEMASNKPLQMQTLPVVKMQGAYLGAVGRRLYNGDALPSRFEGATGITVKTRVPVNIGNILSMIGDITKIPVDRQFSSKFDDINSESIPLNIANKLNEVANGSDAALSSKLSTQREMQLDYTGSLSGLLNMVALNYDLSWKFEQGRIVFSDEETKTFEISLLPGKYSTSNTVGSESEGGESNSGGDESTLSFDVELDFWKDIDSNMKIILSDKGSYSISTSTSSVTVRTSPSNMKRVNNYISSLNSQLEKQVTIDVAVYTVSTSDVSNLSLSLQALLKRNGGVLGSINSSFAASDGTPSISGFLNGDGDQNNQVLLNLLAESGKVSVVTSAAVTTMSGQPAPLKVGNDRAYISEIGTVLGQTSTTNNASTSTVTTGFLMNLLPKIGRDGKIFLRYGITMSSLVGKNDGFDQAKVGDTIIQLPNVDSTTFVQSSMLKNGSTLVLAGYEQKRNETSDQGIGSPKFKLLGGQQSGLGKRDIKVICITPRIIDVKGSNK